jgi:hypothetical protein
VGGLGGQVLVGVDDTPPPIKLAPPPVTKSGAPRGGGGGRGRRSHLTAAQARKLLGWPNICKLAYAFLWEYSYKRLKLAQLLGQLGVFLTPPTRPPCVIYCRESLREYSNIRGGVRMTSRPAARWRWR